MSIHSYGPRIPQLTARTTLTEIRQAGLYDTKPGNERLVANEKGRTGVPVRPFAWSAAGKCRQRSLYR